MARSLITHTQQQAEELSRVQGKLRGLKETLASKGKEYFIRIDARTVISKRLPQKPTKEEMEAYKQEYLNRHNNRPERWGE